MDGRRCFYFGVDNESGPMTEPKPMDPHRLALARSMARHDNAPQGLVELLADRDWHAAEVERLRAQQLDDLRTERDRLKAQVHTAILQSASGHAGQWREEWALVVRWSAALAEMQRDAAEGGLCRISQGKQSAYRRAFGAIGEAMGWPAWMRWRQP